MAAVVGWLSIALQGRDLRVERRKTRIHSNENLHPGIG